MEKGKRIYFASDTHFGSWAREDTKEVEKRFVRFLNKAAEDASHIYLLGDMIDFWYEYRYVVPKGFTRFFGKLSELTDRGIEIHWFIGNHDLWMKGYLEEECGVQIHYRAQEVVFSAKRFFLSHGDGLYDPSLSFRMIRSIFHSKICQTLFSSLHPWIGMGFGLSWSKKSRLKYKQGFLPFMGEEKEHLIRFAKDYVCSQPIDFFLFGHRHIMYDMLLPKGARVLMIGDWIYHFSYAVFDGQELLLEVFEE